MKRFPFADRHLHDDGRRLPMRRTERIEKEKCMLTRIPILIRPGNGIDIEMMQHRLRRLPGGINEHGPAARFGFMRCRFRAACRMTAS
ncbi:MAG: hypothetical protein ACEB74_10090 [Desulfovibrio aminophilus]|uniref:hypothetical protein n=1 Tax=Desulfovibrio aminophilus TaxID=81425 RepID=UPI0039EC7EDF